jgi:adenylate cyclase
VNEDPIDREARRLLRGADWTRAVTMEGTASREDEPTDDPTDEPTDEATPSANEEFWRKFLLEGDPKERAGRRVFRWLPASPRCGLCLAPFAGVGGAVLRIVDKRPSQQNPNVCNSCFKHLSAMRGGAEVTATLLFADIRGSTALAEGMATTDYQALLGRFYAAAAEAVFGADGAIDKFVGDEVVAFFVPGFMADREHHAAQAVEAAVRLLRLTGHADGGSPWLPIGAGVHTGRVWMGAIGDGPRVDLTAVGDAVNVAARLGSVAQAGQVIVSADAAAAAELDASLPRRRLQLKGKADAVEVVEVSVGAA